MTLSYMALVLALAAVTAGEWAAYLNRDAWGIGVDWLMPSLLALSFLKFAWAVYYFIHGSAIGWAKKALITLLVVAGGGTILLAYQL